MIPIYEQGTGSGIGHSLESFQRRFEQICAEHLAKGRARSFAFIFYDFTDRELRQILKDQGAFAQLDRLAGTELSLFYLHTGTKAAVDSTLSTPISYRRWDSRIELPFLASSSSA